MIAAASTTLSTRLKPYAEHKDSGLLWLGRVPGHWKIKRAELIFHCIDRRSPTGTLRALYCASQLYQCFADEEIALTLSAQLNWSHFIEPLPIRRLPNPEGRQ